MKRQKKYIVTAVVGGRYQIDELMIAESNRKAYRAMQKKLKTMMQDGIISTAGKVERVEEVRL